MARTIKLQLDRCRLRLEALTDALALANGFLEFRGFAGYLPTLELNQCYDIVLRWNGHEMSEAEMMERIDEKGYISLEDF